MRDQAETKKGVVENFENGGILMILPTLEKGAKLGEINRKISESIIAVQDEGVKKPVAKVKIEFTVELNEMFGEPAVGITAEVKQTLPMQKVKASVFFANDKGGLSRDPFRQQDLPLSGPQSDDAATRQTVSAGGK